MDVLKYAGLKEEIWSIEEIEKLDEGDDLQYCGVVVDDESKALKVIIVYAVMLHDGQAVVRYATSWN